MPGKQDEKETRIILERTTDLLNDAYETVDGACSILDMVYERLQESLGENSVELAGIVSVVCCCLRGSVEGIGKAEEALSDLKSKMKERR